MAVMTKQFAQEMKKARESLGITKYRLSKTTGISEALVGRYEAGKQFPADETVAKLAFALSYSYDRLLAAAWADRHGADSVRRVQGQAPDTLPIPFPVPPAAPLGLVSNAGTTVYPWTDEEREIIREAYAAGVGTIRMLDDDGFPETPPAGRRKAFRQIEALTELHIKLRVDRR